MGDVFKNAGQRLATGPVDQTLESRADERQCTGGVGIADQTLIFLPAGVPLPVFAFAAPVRSNHLGHGLVTFGLHAPTGDKMPSEILLPLAGPSFSRCILAEVAVAGSEKLFGLGKIGGLRIGAHAAEFALDGATVLAVDRRKRGAWSAN